MAARQLARHQAIHVRAFKCARCHFSFNTEELLEKHKETHSVGGKFKCNTCGKLFEILSQMRYHQRQDHLISKKSKNNVPVNNPQTQSFDKEQKWSPTEEEEKLLVELSS